MLDLTTLTEFLGWCSVINFGILFFMGFMLLFMKDFLADVYSQLLNIEEKEFSSSFLQTVGNYKMAVFIFNFVPYLSLKIMT